MVYIEPSDKSWRFAMSQSDSATATWDTASAAVNSAQAGVWTRVTATYNQTTGAITLAAKGVRAAIAPHQSAWNATGQFHIGHATSGAGADTGYLAGQIANVQAWNTSLAPDALPTVGRGKTNDTDVNGDGRADLVAQNTASSSVMTSAGASYNPAVGWSNQTFSGNVANLIGDVNGDGLADLVA